MMSSHDLTIEELFSLPAGEVSLLDLRDTGSTAYGMLPKARAMAGEELKAYLSSLPPAIKAVLYCTRGETSQEILPSLLPLHEETYSLTGGFMAYLSYLMDPGRADGEAAGWKVAGEGNKETEESAEEETLCARAEKSIRKKFHKQLFTPFAKACRDYQLLSPGDKVAVCMSGGKDSMLMAKLFQELRRHDKFPFDLTFLVMDPGYSEVNRKLIEHNARVLEIPIQIFESTIFDAVYGIEKNPCYLCARMRRGHLYAKAKELGCNKIALGHHYDDVIETILMGMLYGGQVQTMMPKLHSTNFPGMELIRPMYLIREEDIKHWRDYNHLTFLQCACHFTENCSSCAEDGQTSSKRLEIKNLIASLKETNPSVEANIFRSMENVNLSTCICYKKDGVRHSFLEDYDKPQPE